MKIAPLLACSAGLTMFGAGARAAPSAVELQGCAGLPCAAFQANGQVAFKLLIDTGNAQSVLDLVRAKALGVALRPYQSKSGQVVPGYQVGTLKGPDAGPRIVGRCEISGGRPAKGHRQGRFSERRRHALVSRP